MPNQNQIDAELRGVIQSYASASSVMNVVLVKIKVAVDDVSCRVKSEKTWASKQKVSRMCARQIQDGLKQIHSNATLLLGVIFNPPSISNKLETIFANDGNWKQMLKRFERTFAEYDGLIRNAISLVGMLDTRMPRMAKLNEMLELLPKTQSEAQKLANEFTDCYKTYCSASATLSAV